MRAAAQLIGRRLSSQGDWSVDWTGRGVFGRCDVRLPGCPAAGCPAIRTDCHCGRSTVAAVRRGGLEECHKVVTVRLVTVHVAQPTLP